MKRKYYGLCLMVITFLCCMNYSGYSQRIVINEIMSANDASIADADDDHEDWLELYNVGDDSVSLEGFGLTDDEDEPYQWVFPDTTMAPGAFMVIWASGKDRADGNDKIPFFKRLEKFMNYEPIPDPPRPLHTNFKINSDGEELLLTGPSGKLMDRIEPVEIPADITFGRYPDGDDNMVFFDETTPGKPNSDSYYKDIPE